MSDEPTPTARKKLNARQESFVFYYAAGTDGTKGNATKSAIAAGYSPKSAKTVGPRLLENVGIQQALIETRKKLGEGVAAAIVPWADLASGAQRVLVDVSLGTVPAKEGGVRMLAADKILDRAFGKPPVRLQHAARSIDDVLREIDEEEARKVGGGAA